MHLAAYKGHTEVVEILIGHGADLHARTLAGLTPLDWARRKGHREVERLLLAHAAGGGQPSAEVAAPTHEPATPAEEADRTEEAVPDHRVAGKSHRIQLGSFNGREAALATWERCRLQHAELLADLDMRIEAVELRGRVYHRLRAGGFSVDEARRVCAELTQSGQPCIVVRP